MDFGHGVFEQEKEKEGRPQAMHVVNHFSANKFGDGLLGLQPETRNPKLETRNPKPETQNPKPQNPNP